VAIRKTFLLTSSLIISGMLLAPQASALFGAGDVVTDPGLYSVMNTVQGAVTEAIQNMANSIVSRITGLETSVNQVLRDGFTQNANYYKAQIGAQEQIADASNTAMAQYQRSIRNAQIRDQFVTTPEACQALDGGQAITVAAGQSWKVSQAIEAGTDPRGEAAPGTPAWEGQGQAMQAITQLHMSRYCSQAEAQTGLCAASQRENADQRVASLIEPSSYATQQDIDAAIDYSTNLIQPVPPGALRGDQLTSTAGQDAWATRRGYNAAMSLARGVLSKIISSRTPSVQLTATQQQQLKDLGLPEAQTMSWYGILELEATRRAGDLNWARGLQRMPEKDVLIEIATEMALANYIQLQNFSVGQQKAALEAALLAHTVQAERRPAITMPVPQVASGGG